MGDSFVEKIYAIILTMCLFITSCIICFLFFTMGEQYGKSKYEKIILDNITTEQLIDEIAKRVGE